MKTSEKNLIIPDDRREPGDVYMILSPEGKVMVISTVDLIYKRFTDFVNDGAFYALRDHKPPYMNNFFVQYRFPDPKMIPSWDAGADTDRYFNKLQTAIRELGLEPMKTARLYPAMYCYTRSLEPLAPENAPERLAQEHGYQIAAVRYSDFGAATGQNNYTGIETDRGVLLFDATQKGKELQKRYRQFYTNHFFDPRLDISFFRVLELIPTEAQRAKANPDLSALYEDGPEPFGVLSGNCYIDAKEIGVHTVNERVDMLATLANFASISQMDKGEIPDLPDDTYEISCLLYLASPESKEPFLQDEFPNFFSYYDRFKPLAKRFEEAGAETGKAQVMAGIRKLAEEILRQDFPNIRQAKPTHKEQNKAAVTPECHRAKQLLDVTVKLAKLAKTPQKKGKGIL